MKSLKVITQDRPGLIAEITEKLADQDINILEIEGNSIDQQAVIELIVEASNDAMHVLTNLGFKVVSNEIITIRIVDKPGALAQITRELNDAKISIRGITTLQRQDGYCFVALSTDNDAVARKLLHNSLI